MSLPRKIKFPSASSADWVKIAAQEINHSDPFDKLSQTVNGISVKPYYDANNVSRVEMKESTSPFKSWLNVPVVSVHEAKSANQTALNHLNAGGDGILFDLKSNVSAEDILGKIELPFCHLFFKGDQAIISSFSVSLNNWLAKKNWNEVNLTIYQPHEFYLWDFKAGIIHYGIEVTEETDCISQLTTALISIVAQIELMVNSKTGIEETMRSISVLWPVRTHFFISIAEMRALRMLWNLLCEAYSVSGCSLFVHAYSSAWSKETFQPHANLIKQTASGLSAVLGSCNALTCEVEDQNVSMLVRTARNISSVLKDEAHLDKVNDPVAGSYYVENVAVELAEKAWKEFQEKI